MGVKERKRDAIRDIAGWLKRRDAALRTTGVGKAYSDRLGWILEESFSFRGDRQASLVNRA